MIHAMRNCVTEWSYTSVGEYKDPFSEIKLHALVTDPDGDELRVPAFWAGGTDWCIRFSSPKTGIHRFRTDCSDSSNDSLHGLEGEIRVTEYTGENPLFLHGPLRKSVDSTYLEHSDGTPFYWLADTWWMGLTKRLRWPEGFQTLLQDRVQKGFSVVQIVAGLYPDMHPFDERGANEAGFPWDEKFTSVNPSYFDMADRRLACLVDAGIVPCIVGCWGFFIDFAGREAVKKHWDYLVARYAAYPVVFCLAGEALMPFYLSEFRDPEKRPAHDVEMRKGWTEITRYVQELDPFHRPITIHATKFGHEMLDDPALLDLNMLQTGHGGFHSLAPTAEMIETAVTRKPRLPVIDSEVCYEGICGTSYEDVQRFLFWSCALSGACGHTYGANGIWQLNSREELYGPSPHGSTWGNTPWEEAYLLPGSKQVGLGKRLLERYDWWKFEPHPEWVECPAGKDNGYLGAYAAGIPGNVRVIFLPNLGSHIVGSRRGEILVKELEPGVKYRAYHYDPVTGEDVGQGSVEPDSRGSWKSGSTSIYQDWVLVLEQAE